MDFPLLLSYFVLEGVRKRRVMERAIEGLPWICNLGEESLQFGDELHCPMQVIGTFNHNDGTFLWSFENPGIPEPLTQTAKYLHQYFGEGKNVEALLPSKISGRESIFLEELGFIASASLNGSLHYTGWGDESQPSVGFHLMARGNPIDIPHAAETSLLELSFIVQEATMRHAFNHKIAIETFLQSLPFQVAQLDSSMRISDEKNSIEFDFDSESRIAVQRASFPGAPERR